MNIYTGVKYFVFLLVMAVAFASCRKYNDDTTTSTADKQYIVSFSTAGVDITTTDSMTTTFINGTDTVKKTGVRGGSFYSISLNGLKTSTSYTTLTKVYTAADTSGNRHMYRLSGTVSTSTGATVLAPTATTSDSWKTCYIYYNSTYDISFAMAASPTDPYFELTLPTSLAYKNVYIDRNLYLTTSSVKSVVKFGSVILKAASYKGYHANSTAFATFATQAASVTYDAADFSLQLYNETSNDYKILVFQEQTL